jgi:hypothetical protein
VAVSIKIGEHSKRRLDRLRSDLGSMVGRQLTLQEIVDALVEVGEADRAEVLGRLSRVKLPITGAARERILNASWDWGVETSEEDIDRTLYSREAIFGREKPVRKARR